MAAKGLRLYALTNHIITTHAERENGDAAACASALFAVTAKSLGGSGVQTNARDQVLRHHYTVMDRLREVSQRLNAGEALPHDPPPSRVIQQATRLKELSRALRQFSGEGLSSITSPRTARQICRIFRLGDDVFAEWQAQQRGRGRQASEACNASGSKGRRPPTPFPTNSAKRKTPEKQQRSASGLAPASSPVAAAEAAARGEPQMQRQRSSEEEGSSLMPKQLFVGRDESGAALSPHADASEHSSQQRMQGPPRQACEEWAAFKAFMASPRRPAAPPAAQQAAEQPQHEQDAAQQGQHQPMDVDGRGQESLAVAATSAMVEQPGPEMSRGAAGRGAAAPASGPAAVPLSPKQAMLVEPPPDLTPQKLLPAPGLCNSPIDKENGSRIDRWTWDRSSCAPEAWPAAAPAAAVAGNGHHTPAAVRRGLLVLQSPATERAASAREQMAAEAAEVLATDLLRLLSESDIMLRSAGIQAPCDGDGTRVCSGPDPADTDPVGSDCSRAEEAGLSAAGGPNRGGTSEQGVAEAASGGEHAGSSGSPTASPASSASSGGSSSRGREAAASQEVGTWQPRMAPVPAEAPLRRTLAICTANRLFEFDAAAVKGAAAAPAVHAGGSLQEWQTRHNLNAAGRAHSIMRPIALPAAV